MSACSKELRSRTDIKQVSSLQQRRNHAGTHASCKYVHDRLSASMNTRPLATLVHELDKQAAPILNQPLELRRSTRDVVVSAFNDELRSRADIKQISSLQQTKIHVEDICSQKYMHYYV